MGSWDRDFTLWSHFYDTWSHFSKTWSHFSYLLYCLSWASDSRIPATSSNFYMYDSIIVPTVLKLFWSNWTKRLLDIYNMYFQTLTHKEFSYLEYQARIYLLKLVQNLNTYIGPQHFTWRCNFIKSCHVLFNALFMTILTIYHILSFTLCNVVRF